MTEPVRPSPAGNGGGFRLPFSLRTGAILLMVAGAAGFVAARLMFGDQVLCLLGSTLVVFAGLGVIVYGRRNSPGAEADEMGSQGYDQRPLHGQRPLPPPGSAQSTRVSPRSMPRGLRAAARQQANQPPVTPRHTPPDPRPIHTEPMMRPNVMPGPEPIQTGGNTLLDAVITTFEQQGARVGIETQRADRGILAIQAADGLQYAALVLEDPGQVDVADVRALYALMSSSGSVGGYLIAAGDFSQRAYDWASQHRIRLVAADEIDELGI